MNLIARLLTADLVLGAGIFLTALATTPAGAADIAAGKTKAEQVCSACHGADGNTPIDPSYPKLAGQHRDYLERALLDYKSEKRKNAIMGATSKTLSRDDIDNLSAYFSSLPGSLVVRH
jgi:cytochrome c553